MKRFKLINLRGLILPDLPSATGESMLKEISPTINYPKRKSEVEIQALLFNKIRKRFRSDRSVDVRMEVAGKNGLKRHRFDIVIFVEKQPWVIVEVKRSKKGVRSKQEKEYMEYGIPFICCNNESSIPLTLRKIVNYFQKVSGRATN